MKDRIMSDADELGEQLQEEGINIDDELTAITDIINETGEELEDITDEIETVITCMEHCQSEQGPQCSDSVCDYGTCEQTCNETPTCVDSCEDSVPDCGACDGPSV